MSHPAGPPTPPWPGGPPQGAAAVCVRHPDRPRGSAAPGAAARPARTACARPPSVTSASTVSARATAGRVAAVTIAGARARGAPARHPDARRAERRGLRVDGRHLGQRLEERPRTAVPAVGTGARRRRGRRVVAGDHRRVPALRPHPPAVQHDGAVGDRQGHRTGAGPVAVPGRLPGLAARRVGGGDAAVGAQLPRRGGVGGGVRTHGGARGAPASAADPPGPGGRAHRGQSRDHVPAARHLGRRPPRRSHGRRPRHGGAGLRPGGPAGAGADRGARRSHAGAARGRSRCA